MKTQKEKYIFDELSDFQKTVIAERLGIGVDSKKELRKSREEVAVKWNVAGEIIKEAEEKAINLLIPMKTREEQHTLEELPNELSDFQKAILVERLGIGIDRKQEFHKSREEVAQRQNTTEEIIRKTEEKAINLLLSRKQTPKQKYMLDELSDFQKEVIAERLGIGEDRRRSRKEVAERRSATEEIIRKTEEKAINLLLSKKREKHIVDELADSQKAVVADRLGIGFDGSPRNFQKSRKEVASLFNSQEEGIKKDEESAISLLTE